METDMDSKNSKCYLARALGFALLLTAGLFMIAGFVFAAIGHGFSAGREVYESLSAWISANIH